MAKFTPNFVLHLSLGFLSFSLALAADNSGVKFLYPNDPALVFYYLDTINVTYQSPYPTPGLWTFCKDVNVNTYVPSKYLNLCQKIRYREIIVESLIQSCLEHVDSVPPFNGSFLVKIDWKSVSEGCWFNLRQGVASNSVGPVNSPEFKVLTRGVTAGLTSATTAGPTSTPTSLPTTTPNPTTTPTAALVGPTTTPNPEVDKTTKESSGISTGAKAAIGVAIPLAVIAVLAGVFLFWRRRKAVAAPQHAEVAEVGYSNGVYTGVYEKKPRVDQGPQELQGNMDGSRLNSNYPVEMDSAQIPELGHGYSGKGN